MQEKERWDRDDVEFYKTLVFYKGFAEEEQGKALGEVSDKFELGLHRLVGYF